VRIKRSGDLLNSGTGGKLPSKRDSPTVDNPSTELQKTPREVVTNETPAGKPKRRLQADTTEARENRRQKTGKARDERATKAQRRSETVPLWPAQPAQREVPDFELEGALPRGFCVIEASAGTGKTYTLTALVVRYIAEDGITADQLLMVTFTRAAASEMRQKTRAAIASVLEIIDSGEDPKEEWIQAIIENNSVSRAEKVRRLENALKDLDLATITTIHGFCQQLLRRIGFNAGDVASAEVDTGGSDTVSEILRDRLLQVLALNPSSFGSVDSGVRPDRIEENIAKVLRQISTNQGSSPAPTSSVDEVVDRWKDTAKAVAKSAQDIRIRSGIIGFDDLILETARMISDEVAGPAVLMLLRETYRVVMIDEFQDTDLLQWGIFRDAFVDFNTANVRPVVVCVGDPKQAIYRFRGADIDAYLGALETFDASKYTLRKNFRTDKAIVESMNVLMRDLDLGRGSVRYVQVEAARQVPEAGLVGATPFEIRWLSQSVDLGSGKQKAEEVRRHIADDLAEHVSHLLRNCTIKLKKDDIESERRIEPKDIAVLVRANDDATYIESALLARGIPAVRNKIGSVVESQAMDQLRLLADALARPSDANRVRALMLSWFFKPTPQDLNSAEVTAGLQDQCRVWSAELAHRGVVGFFEVFRASPGVLESIASVGNFERNITDLEHIIELAHRASKGAPLTAGVLRRILADLATDEEERDEYLRRTESDAAAVQIMSMHGSKGLEYPVVLLPYPKQLNNRSPYVFSSKGTRYVDAAPMIDWIDSETDRELRKHLAEQEISEDERRLIYVALTRARNHLVIWWATTQGVSKGSMASVLFRKGHADGPATAPKDDVEQRAILSLLMDRIGPAMRLSEVTAEISVTPYETSPHRTGTLEVSQVPNNSRSRGDWYRWSFTSLKRMSESGEAERVRGGDDEHGLATSISRDSSEHEHLAGPLMDLPRGTWFGSLIHEVMEHVDFSVSTLREDLRRTIVSRQGSEIAGISIDDLTEGLALSILSPLNGLVQEARLADLKKSERCNEMEFYLPIADGQRRLLRRTIVDIAAEAEGGEVGSHFAALGEAWGNATVGGFLYGSVDAFLRIDGRYFVVDYKSNALHPRDREPLVSDYQTGSMEEEMRHHHYYLQALLYSVGAHRFLRQKIKGYDPTIHFGGAGYLFVRGMVGPSTPVREGVACGVFNWRPSNETIDRLDRFLSGQERG
jgi:exodeoxyribonuclease V beta subunit